MADVNLRHDWGEFLKVELMAYHLTYDPAQSLEENTLRYLNAKRRVPRQVVRTVHESKELRIPAQYASDYAVLKRVLREGGDLTSYLSRDVRRKRADKNDRLLNAWGVQHLHFRPCGTVDVLLVKITDCDAFVIQALPHGHGHSDVWVNTSILQILHDNWPWLPAGNIMQVPGEPLSDTERVALRKNNANFLITMLDGTVCLGDSGIVASGHRYSDIVDSDRIFHQLDCWQKQIEENEANIRAALKMPDSERLSIKLIFENGEFWLCEFASGRKLSLTVQSQPSCKAPST